MTFNSMGIKIMRRHASTATACSAWRKILFSAAAVAGLFGMGAADAWAQKNAPARATTEEQSIVGRNVTLKATYYRSTGEQNSPVVLLLAGRSSNRQVWKPFAEVLQKSGYAVLTVDLRVQGETAGAAAAGAKVDSTPLKALEYQAMVTDDMEAIKKFLFDEHQRKRLNMAKLGIVAADAMASVAICYTEVDWSKTPYDDAPTLALRTPRGQDIKALVLLSPEQNAPGLPVTQSLNKIRNLKIPTLICVSKSDTRDRGAAKKVYSQLAPRKEGFEQIYFEEYPGKAQGTDLMAPQQRTSLHIFNFLETHLKKLNIEWVDRRSRLDRSE